ncbi:pyridoxamine 5'-phosphate oxidase family protein [candidate division WOR-3 bacterium]|nr:pyridoxamine 5'-phosphate oxidase family protein [candidate division WOR-3 bacterium]
MQIPEQVRKLFEQRPLMYLATVDGSGMPNVVPMLQYWWFNDDTMVIGDLFMKATRANVQANGRVCISACGKGNEAFKLRGTASYETSGPAYDLANGELHRGSPDKDFRGVVVFRVTEVYDAAKGPDAGRLLVRVGEPPADS